VSRARGNRGTTQGVICDSCNTRWFGATERDITDAGWTFHVGHHGARFLMCAECEGYYSLVWALRQQPAIP
jgi:hypothetical protein